MPDTMKIRTEIDLARLGAFWTLAAICAVMIAVFGLKRIQETIAVPNLSEGLFRQQTRVTIVQERHVSEPPPEKLIEHTVEQSPYKVRQKKEPAVEVKPSKKTEVESRPQPIKPKPRPVQPKPDPQPRRKSVPQSIKPTAVVGNTARETEDAAQRDLAGAASQRTASGGSVKTAREHALAVIVKVIEANKHYPRRARQTGVEGEVLLTVRTDTAGRVRAVELKRSHRSVLLNRAALRAAQPLIGMSLESFGETTVEVPVVFSLTD